MRSAISRRVARSGSGCPASRSSRSVTRLTHPRCATARARTGCRGSAYSAARVDERATAVLVDDPVVHEGDRPGAQGRLRVVRVLREDPVDGQPRPLGAQLQVGEHEVVLRREVPVEGDPGDRGLVDHPLHPDGLHALLVEQPVGGRDYSLARRGRASRATTQRSPRHATSCCRTRSIRHVTLVSHRPLSPDDHPRYRPPVDRTVALHGGSRDHCHRARAVTSGVADRPTWPPRA